MSSEQLTEDEILQDILNPVKPESNESENDEPENNIISNAEAETMMTKCIDWFEKQEEADTTQLLLLRRIRNIAAVKAEGKCKQKCITHYFT